MSAARLRYLDAISPKAAEENQRPVATPSPRRHQQKQQKPGGGGVSPAVESRLKAAMAVYASEEVIPHTANWSERSVRGNGGAKNLSVHTKVEADDGSWEDFSGTPTAAQFKQTKAKAPAASSPGYAAGSPISKGTPKPYADQSKSENNLLDGANRLASSMQQLKLTSDSKRSVATPRKVMSESPLKKSSTVPNASTSPYTDKFAKRGMAIKKASGARPTPDGGKSRSRPTPDGGKSRSRPTPDGGKSRSRPTPDGDKSRSRPTPDGGKSRSRPTPDAETPRATPSPDNGKPHSRRSKSIAGVYPVDVNANRESPKVAAEPSNGVTKISPAARRRERRAASWSTPEPENRVHPSPPPPRNGPKQNLPSPSPARRGQYLDKGSTSAQRREGPLTLSCEGKISRSHNKPASILKKSAEIQNYGVAYNLNDSSIDPIHRAGIRLLSAAAIPIQTAIRRYLAQNEALDRMWATIVIQQYTRRWLAKEDLHDHRDAATRIQSVWRGWYARESVEEEQYCGTEIQRIARGYIARARVMKSTEDLILHEQATKVQAAWRGYSAQLTYQFDVVDIIIVQSIARRKFAYKAAVKRDAERREKCAIKIQSTWRSYDGSMNYLHTLADILIAQNVVRRWVAMKNYPRLLEKRRCDSAVQIQSAFRGYRARDEYQATKEYLAAVDIQRAWRGFQCFTDYIFSLADVVVAQRTARAWLAKRRTQELREVKAATTIQSMYRGNKVQMTYLYTLIHIIIVQSIFRRRAALIKYQHHLAKVSAARKFQAAWRGYVSRGGQNLAAEVIQRAWRMQKRIQMHRKAVIIQKHWRGCMQYSDYLLVREDIIRIQSAFRGYQEREWLGFQHECAVIIQSSARCFLNRTNVLERKLAQVVLQAKLASLQQKNCAKKIQQTWKNRVNHAKEKEAALIIEQFFITVRKEVDAELARLEQNTPKVKKVKKRKKKRKEKESEDKLLERVWLNTVESMDESAMKRTSQRRSMKSPGIHRSRSEMLGFPAESIDADDDASVVSGITSASFLAKSPPAPNPSSRFKTYNRNQLNDDYSLEEAWVDTEVNHMKEKTRSDDRYMKRHGLDMSPRVVTSREQDRHRGGISRSQSYTERSPASKIRSSRSNSQRQSGFSLSTTISRSGSIGDYPEIRESRTDTRESRTDIRRSDRMKRSSRSPLPRAGSADTGDILRSQSMRSQRSSSRTMERSSSRSNGRSSSRTKRGISSSDRPPSRPHDLPPTRSRSTNMKNELELHQ